MENLKTFLLILFIGFFGLLIFNEASFSQNSKPKRKDILKDQPVKGIDREKISRSKDSYSEYLKNQKNKVDQELVKKKIEINKRPLPKDIGDPTDLNEDFESGNFPPTDWQIGSGSIEWTQAYLSAFGIGNYSTFFEIYNNCNNNNTLTSPVFTSSASNYQLVFDIAYAPYGSEEGPWYDALEILFSQDGGNSWNTLIYYEGQDMQTAPSTFDYFVPNPEDWGTKYVSLPPGTNMIEFNAINQCGNNLYVDNIKVMQVYKLYEDFEALIFPPPDWTMTYGPAAWAGVFYSGYGSGRFSTRCSSWDCYGSNDELASPVFDGQPGDTLKFDHAYAPWYDGQNVVFDNLEIFYSDDNGKNYYSLEYISCEILQTSPATFDYFFPTDDEWGTYAIILPFAVTNVKFKYWEGCSNNLYVDNITVVGQQKVNPYDASIEFVWPKGKLPLGFGVPETIPVLVKNLGKNPIFNLNVSLDITGANYLSDVKQIPVLSPGDTMQVDFLGFTPILNGFCDVTVSIPDDENPGNNSKTKFTEVNPNAFRHVDSNCCNGSVGWFAENAFLNKYKMSGTGQVRKVNVKISDDGNVGQIVYGYVLDNSGNVVGKSPHYKIQAGDQGKYKTFNITDPKPFITTDDYFYVGIAQTDFAGDGIAFTPQQFDYDAPARPDANYGTFLAPVGSNVYIFEFPREWGQNYAIEAIVENQATVDAGISNQGLLYDQYFTSSSQTLSIKVFNAGTGNRTFNVRRTISPGGYTSTKTVSNLASGANKDVTFDSWNFSSGTTYTVRDSILSLDSNNSNNQMTSTITPRTAKQLCVLWSQQQDKDSLVRAINSDGRYASNFDTVRMNYTGSFRPWKIIFANFKNDNNYSPWIRDSLKKFIDSSSTVANKKSLIVFGNTIAFLNDPDVNYVNPADSIFYRQYLKSRTISDNWPANIPNSGNRFRGIGFFNGITQDSISDPSTPELIKPTNGGTAAFKPMSVKGNGADSCNAVIFNNARYNTFFMTNKFSSLRSTGSSPSQSLGPVKVYTKIIDWITFLNTNAKILDLTALIEGFYNAGSNSMIRDTVTVYLRNTTTPFQKVDSAKAYLNTSGQASFSFNNASNGVNYYLHVKHRNGLETWSKTPQMFSSNSMTYNFTTNVEKAFGNNMIQKGSKFCIFSGDVTQDGTVDVIDIGITDNDAFNFVSGYVRTDVNGDGVTDALDVSLIDNNAFNFVGKVVPTLSPEILAKKGIVLDYSQQEVPQNEVESSSIENMIDHEIYERNKNQQPVNRNIPDFIIKEKGGTEKLVKNRYK